MLSVFKCVLCPVLCPVLGRFGGWFVPNLAKVFFVVSALVLGSENDRIVHLRMKKQLRRMLFKLTHVPPFSCPTCFFIFFSISGAFASCRTSAGQMQLKTFELWQDSTVRETFRSQAKAVEEVNGVQAGCPLLAWRSRHWWVRSGTEYGKPDQARCGGNE